MQRGVTRLSPAARTALRVASVILLLVGLALVVAAFIDFFDAASGSASGDFRMPARLWMAFVGAPLFVVGLVAVQMAFLRPLSGIVATETEGAVEVTAGAAGRGLRQAFPAGPTHVKVRCRACGYLDSEDARFCSRCATAL